MSDNSTLLLRALVRQRRRRIATLKLRRFLTEFTEFFKSYGVEKSAQFLETHFVTQVVDSTFYTYFTSELVGETVMPYDPVPVKYEGCLPYEPGQKLWSSV